jgi:hypothetical protein
MKKYFFLIMVPLLLFITPSFSVAYEMQGQKPVYQSMPGPGKKVPINGNFYMIYGFDKKPKLGTVIMKVEIFNNAGKKDTSFVVKADAGMPSMKGAHDSGDRTFQISKRDDYVLPVNIVMPGDWEIKVTIIKNGNPIFFGRYNFEI